jgi:DNA repair protein RecN (Recombination protein N)
VLSHLQIRDFALIDSVEIELRRGLTVLTGETGAGKSIVVDALQLLAGGRAGAEVVRHGAERAEVSGTFDLTRAPSELRQWLEEQSVGAADELTVRRVVGSDGRTRAYLNGQAVPVQLLRVTGSVLIDIHGQHEFQSLARPPAQRSLLDAYGSLTELTAGVGSAHRAWLERLNRTLKLESQARDRDTRLELLRYQVQELEGLRLKADEVGALGEERARLANRGRLAQGAQTALAELYESEGTSAHGSVSRALAALRGLASLDPKLAPVLPLLEEASVQVREAARELERYRETLDVDAARQEEVERRLAAIEELARKHRCVAGELPGRAGQLAAELEALERVELDLAVLRRGLAEALEGYRTRAQELSGKRVRAARELSRDISARMQTLGMTGGRFEADVAQQGNADPTEHGIDQIEFRVTANPGSPPRTLAKVASGGELSRLSLAVQVSCAAETSRCMVFDEVDAGIGGAVAEIVGRELRSLGSRGQVLCVTHLPQVACQAHHHLRVMKLSDGRSARTTLTELTSAERVEELARMLGGIEITEKARAHARDLLAAASTAPAAPMGSAPPASAADPTGEAAAQRRRPAGRRR